MRDAQLQPEIVRDHRDKCGVYGVDEVWAQLNPEGSRVARCNVARLTLDQGLCGVVRGEPHFATVAGDGSDLPRNIPDRRFRAATPSKPWVGGLNYPRTWSGFVYVSFIADVYSRTLHSGTISAIMRAQRTRSQPERLDLRPKRSPFLDEFVHDLRRCL